MSLVIGLGPLAENEATIGADSSSTAMVPSIFAVAFLFRAKKGMH